MTQPAPSTAELRRSIAAELKAMENEANKAAESGTDAPRGLIERANPGGTVDIGYERPDADPIPQPQLTPDQMRAALGAGPSSANAHPPNTPGYASDDYAPRGAKAVTPPPSLMREGLNLVSGGATEEVLAAEAGADEQSKRDVTGKSLSGYSAEELARLRAAAGYTPRGQAAGPQSFVRVNPGWQPNSKTAQSGATGMDPQDRADVMGLQDIREANLVEGFGGAQDAEANEHRMLLEVQNNKLKAEEAFRRDRDNIQQRYDTERAEEMAKLQRIQTEMESLGKQPRTIREWLDKSGTGTRVTYGLAAALSALGGAIGRRGNQPLNDLFNRTQASINAKVEQDKETFARLGERAKLNDAVYARIRQAAGDDNTALNITKAMYYDALGYMVEQVATQYKLDMQSPQLREFLAKIAKERQALIGETATKIQEQQSQTDKYNPGGVFAVGGGAAKVKDEGPGEGETYFNKQKNEYGKERESRKININEDTIEHLDNFDKVVNSLGVKEQDELWGVMAQVATLKDPKLAAGLVMALPEKQARAAALLIQGVEKRRHALSGANYTVGEGIGDLFKLGGATRAGIRSYRNELAAEKDASIAALGAGYPGGIPEAYESDRVLRRRTGPMVTPGGRSLNPSDMTDKGVTDQPKVR